jgi:hypothetical protein
LFRYDSRTLVEEAIRVKALLAKIQNSNAQNKKTRRMQVSKRRLHYIHR